MPTFFEIGVYIEVVEHVNIQIIIDFVGWNLELKQMFKKNFSILFFYTEHGFSVKPVTG